MSADICYPAYSLINHIERKRQDFLVYLNSEKTCLNGESPGAMVTGRYDIIENGYCEFFVLASWTDDCFLNAMRAISL